MPTPRICSVEDCGKPCRTRGYCIAHYKRWSRHGSPTAGQHPRGTHKRFYREVILTHNSNDCLIWPFTKSPQGYSAMVADGVMRNVHRLVCESVHGPKPPDKNEAAHSCGVRACVNWRHIRWATYAENNADKLIHDTHNRGERQGAAKLTAEKVLRIRELSSQFTLVELAETFGIGHVQIWRIINRKQWTHI